MSRATAADEDHASGEEEKQGILSVLTHLGANGTVTKFKDETDEYVYKLKKGNNNILVR